MPYLTVACHVLPILNSNNTALLMDRTLPVFFLQQYVPLFLSKEDLDIAVQSAYKQRNAAQIKMYKDKALKYQDEFDQVGQGLSRLAIR